MRRKGELSPAGVDRGWPHQVALPAEQCSGKNTAVIHEFCKDLSLCSRGRSVMREDGLLHLNKRTSTSVAARSG